MRLTPTSRMLARYRKPEPAWVEPLRIAATVIWTFAFAFYVFYQNYWFYTAWPWYDAYSLASIMAGIQRPLWYASFSFSMSLALALYLVTHLYRSGGETAVTIGLRKSGRTQIIATLCLAVCGYLLYVRITPIFPMTSNGVDHLPAPLLEFRYGAGDPWPITDWSTSFVWIGLLTAMTILVRGWGLLPMVGVGRRNFLWIGAGLTVVGLLLPITLLPSLLPPRSRQALERLENDTPAVNGLVLGDQAGLADARLFRFLYLETRNDNGLVIPQSDVDKNRMSVRDFPENWDSPPELCELCQIPGVPYWTTYGLPLLLSDEPLLAGEPDLVLELPRAGWYYRSYEPVLNAKNDRRSLQHLSKTVQGKTWVILKIDWTLKTGQVLDILQELKDGGVIRVDLAVVPYGFADMGDRSARLLPDDDPAWEPYRPAKAEQVGRKVIVVKKYTPPPKFAGPHQQVCRSVSRWDAWLYGKYLPERPGSLSRQVSVPVVDGMNYGELVQYLAGAMAGGAEEIGLQVVDEDREEQP